MAILNKGTTYASGNNVTAANLNALVDNATFKNGSNEATDNSTLQVHTDGYIKIKDSGVTSTQLATDAVTTVKITDANVTAAKLASDSVISSKILNSNVVTDKIANNAITLAKMEDGTRGDIITYDSATEPTRLAIGSAGKYLRVNSAGTDIEWASRKFATGWANTHGSVTVANGSTHTITHSLGTKDVIVEVYISSASDGSNPQAIMGVSSSSASNRGGTVTDLADNTATIQLGSSGFLDTDSSGNMSVTTFTSKYINIVVIG